ncbi:ABC transporter substrate-binding protein [Actinoplanes sp. NPDC026619]|uniref:ABC transporter substrate-binding protein n=1 Tax=Actinoplanes sp. NPDC026619 TaxID=3155798 RepID=UPI0034096A37
MSIMSRRGLLAGALALSTALAVAACGGGSSSSSSSAKLTTLTLAAPNGPNNLDPALNGNGTPLVWFTQLDYEPLIRRSPDGTAQPALATKWEYSADRLKFVMQLRDGVKFSNGEALTADAVVKSLEYVKKNTLFQFLVNVKSFVATGPLEVTFNLSTPDPLLPFSLDQEGQVGDIIAPAGVANPKQLQTESFGAGPYVLDSKTTIANSQYVYVKNPNYYDPSKQNFEKVVIKVIADDNATLAALRSGQVQAAQVNNNTATVGQSFGLNLTKARSAMVGFYLFDLAGKVQPALAKKEVRQAMQYAIDRAGVTKAIYGVSAAPTEQYSAEGTAGYLAGLDSRYPYDPAKAKELLAQAGYPNGFSMDLLVQPGALNQNLLAQAVAEQWKAIGINVKLTAPAVFTDYVKEIGSGKYPIGTFNFYYGTHLLIMQGLFTKPALYNFFGYDDKQSNVYATEERKYDPDSPESNKVAEEFQTYVVEQAFAVPVATADTLMLSTKSITGLEFTNKFPIPDPVNWKPAS